MFPHTAVLAFPFEPGACCLSVSSALSVTDLSVGDGVKGLERAGDGWRGFEEGHVAVVQGDDGKEGEEEDDDEQELDGMCASDLVAVSSAVPFFVFVRFRALVHLLFKSGRVKKLTCCLQRTRKLLPVRHHRRTHADK